MLTKLLLTIGVIILVVVAFRSRGRGGPAPNKPRDAPTQASASPTRITAWILIGVIIAVSVGMTLYQQLNEPAAVNVLVINTSTGERRHYQALREDAGKRRFQTVDGRTIILAETERAEVLSTP